MRILLVTVVLAVIVCDVYAQDCADIYKPQDCNAEDDCSYDYTTYTCRDKVCEDYTEEDPCEAAGCSYSSPLFRCFVTGQPIPCSAYFDEDSCNSAQEGCEYDSGAFYCKEQGTDTPCGRFSQESSCPDDRCRYIEDLFLCIGTDEDVPCNKYADSQSCNAVENNRCEYDEEASFCKDQGTVTPCGRYFEATPCRQNSDRCSYDESQFTCYPCGDDCGSDNSGSDDGDTGEPCDTYVDRVVCPVTRCVWEQVDYVCRIRGCSDIFEETQCNELEGCAFNDDVFSCYDEGEGARCSLFYSKDLCDGEGSRCEFDDDNDFCNEAGEETPCSNLNEEVCGETDRCEWDDGAVSCKNNNEVLPCHRFFSSDGCPDDRCEFDEAAQYCKDTGTETHCGRYFQEAGCSANSPRCGFDPNTNECRTCPEEGDCFFGDDGGPSGSDDTSSTVSDDPCDEIESEIECPTERCTYDVDEGCRDLTCSDVFESESCQVIAGCIWDESIFLCYDETVGINCNFFQNAEDCSNNGCSYDEEMSYCNAEGESTPCAFYSEETGSGSGSDEGTSCSEQQGRCEWVESAEFCVDEGEDVPCDRYFRQDDCPEPRCEFEAGSMRCKIAGSETPCRYYANAIQCNRQENRCVYSNFQCLGCSGSSCVLENSTSNDPCDTYRTQRSCPTEESRCAYDQETNECRDPVCTDYFDEQLCILSGCVYNNEVFYCYAEEDGIPCDRYFDADLCGGAEGCAFDEVAFYCHPENEETPCARYYENTTCPSSRCEYDSAALYCKDTGSDTPCTRYSTEDSCPSSYCEFDRAATHCKEIGTETPCQNFFQRAQCNSVSYCVFDTTNQACHRCDPEDEGDCEDSGSGDDGGPCNSYDEEDDCPFERCVWDIDGAEGGNPYCRDKECDNFGEQYDCESSPKGCTWIPNLFLCIPEGESVPCDRYYEESACTAEGTGCEYESDANFCYAEGSTPECSQYYQEELCPDTRCEWSDQANLCHTAGEAIPCESYFESQPCQSAPAGCEFDQYAFKCHPQGEEVPCSDYFNQYVCDSLTRCEYNDNSRSCDDCPSNDCESPPLQQCSELDQETCDTQRCEYSQGECLANLCTDLQDVYFCENTDGCTYDSNARYCYGENDIIPCNLYIDEDYCPEDRCVWDEEGLWCKGESEETPCFRYAEEETCNDQTERCEWDNYCQDYVIDNCAPEPCDPLTTCINGEGTTYSCTACPAGTTGSGETGCIDIDECADNPCDPLTDCINGDNSYTCTDCPEGFVGNGKDSRGCRDIDECARGRPCHRLTQCFNTPGSFNCSACPTGYTGDGMSGCVDIDECAENPCDPLTECSTASWRVDPGDYMCTDCPDGYTGNGKDAGGCVEIDECDVTPPPCGERSCTDKVNGVECGDCPEGTTLEWNGCRPITCNTAGIRAPRYGSRDPRDPCREYNCVVTFACNSGYFLRGEAQLRCQSDGEWSAPQPSCTTDVDACAAFPCEGENVACQDIAGAPESAEGRICLCADGFVDDDTTDDTLTCVDVDACVDFPCAQYSTGCTDIPGEPNSPDGRECGECQPGFQGDGNVCNGAQCPADIVATGNNWNLDDADCSDQFYPSGECTILCAAGYGGSTTFTCDSHGNWVGSHECVACADGEFSGNLDETCTPYTVCDETEFQYREPTFEQDRMCLPLSECGISQYETTAPTETSDRVCSPCNSCDAGEYRVEGSCTGSTDTQCATCSECGGLTVQECTQVQDTVCGTCDNPDCGAGQYSRRCAEESVADSVSGYVCGSWSFCRVGYQELAAGTLTSDRQCTATSASDSAPSGRRYSLAQATLQGWNSAIFVPSLQSEFKAAVKASLSCSACSNVQVSIITAIVLSSRRRAPGDLEIHYRVESDSSASTSDLNQAVDGLSSSLTDELQAQCGSTRNCVWNNVEVVQQPATGPVLASAASTSSDSDSSGATIAIVIIVLAIVGGAGYFFVQQRHGQAVLSAPGVPKGMELTPMGEVVTQPIHTSQRQKTFFSSIPSSSA